MEEDMEIDDSDDGVFHSGNVLLVDSEDLEGAVEGTGSTPMDIESRIMEQGGGVSTRGQGQGQEIIARKSAPMIRALEQDDEEDREEHDPAMITRIEDIRHVTSQYLQGDLTSAEYAVAIEGLVDDPEEEVEDEIESQTVEVSFDRFLKAQNRYAAESKSDPSSSSISIACRRGQSGSGSGGQVGTSGGLDPLTIVSTQMTTKRDNSTAGFYGTGTDPTTFTIFRKRKLSTTLQRLIGAAHVRYAQGDYQSAIEMCMEIIKEQPTCIEPFQTLSMIYENQGRTSKSLQYALIAALLSPRSCAEWPKLGEMSFDENNFPQAIMCYNKAIKVEPRNSDLYKRRCELMDLYGDQRAALKAYAQILIMFPDERALCIDVLRKMARIYYDNGDMTKAYETLNVAFNDHFKSQLATEEINLMLELCITLKRYVEAFEILLDHAGVEIEPHIDPIAYESRIALTNALKSEDLVCKIPTSLNIELLTKLIGVLIHLEAFHLSEKLVVILKASDVNAFGDLYLDVAEAYMSKLNYDLAVKTLLPLIESRKFSVAAVWLRYAECLFLLQRLEDAAEAYEKVVVLAPNHTLAKLNLSIILQRLGRADDALETLVHAEKEEDPIDPALLIERCNILLKSRRISDFIQAAMLLLTRHCLNPRNLEECQVIVMATNKTRKRHEALYMDRRNRGEPLDDNAPNFINKETNLVSEFKIYLKLCQILAEMERYDILSNVVYSACTSKLFSSNPRMEQAIEMHCFYASLMCSDVTMLPYHVRFMLSLYPDNKRVLNMFSMILKRCESDTRYARHVLRLLMKRPNDTRLMLLNAHISFVTGTYKNALMEYTTLFSETPKDPIVPLMIASALLHVLLQKTSSSRAHLCISIIAFMKRYMELRGECQEAFYNMGRAMHFLGFFPLAIHYYKRALATKPVPPRGKKKRANPILLGNETMNVLDLRREAAFNLVQIYKSTGAFRLARLYLYNFIRV